jgi:hypothetical protein
MRNLFLLLRKIVILITILFTAGKQSPSKFPHELWFRPMKINDNAWRDDEDP